MRELAFFFLSVLLVGCVTNREQQGSWTPLRDIKGNPQSYAGKVIIIEGEVVSSLPVLGGLFQVYEAYSDDTLWVKVLDGQELPKVRRFVRVRGTIDSGFKILNQSYGLVFQAGDIQDLSLDR